MFNAPGEPLMFAFLSLEMRHPPTPKYPKNMTTGIYVGKEEVPRSKVEYRTRVQNPRLYTNVAGDSDSIHNLSAPPPSEGPKRDAPPLFVCELCDNCYEEAYDTYHHINTNNVISHHIPRQRCYSWYSGLLLGYTRHDRVVNRYTMLTCSRSEA